MSDVPPVVPPTPAPSVASAFMQLMRAIGALPLWHVVQGGGTGIGKGLWYAAGCLPYVASAAFLMWLAHQQGCTLPGPNPPAPPGPVDPLTASMHAAYIADPDPAKAAHTGTLAQVLASVVPAARTAGTVKTTADLVAVVKAATKNAIGDGTIPAVRKAVGVYLNDKLPTAPATPMTDQLWLAATSDFAIVADALTKGAK